MTVNYYFSGCGPVQAAEHMKESGFSAAGCSDYCQKFSFIDHKIYAGKSVNGVFALPVYLYQILCFQDTHFITSLFIDHCLYI